MATLNRRSLTYLRKIVPALLTPEGTLRSRVERRNRLRDITTPRQRAELVRMTLPQVLGLKAMLPP